MWSERKRKKVKCVWNRFKILGKQTSRNLTWAEVSDREARHSGEEREPRLAVCVKPPACRRVNRPRVTNDQGRGGRAMRHLICRPPQRPVNQFLSATQLTDTRRVITVRADAHQEAIREQKSRRAASPSPPCPHRHPTHIYTFQTLKLLQMSVMASTFYTSSHSSVMFMYSLFGFNVLNKN